MTIFVRAKPKSKKPYVKQVDQAHFIVAVSEPPEDGKANLAVIRALADYLQLKRSDVILVSGGKSKDKVFAVPKSSK